MKAQGLNPDYDKDDIAKLRLENWWLLLLNKFDILNFIQMYSIFWNSKDSKPSYIFYLASLVIELLAILLFFTEYKFQKISVSNAATWKQELAADLSLIGKKVFPLYLILPLCQWRRRKTVF